MAKKTSTETPDTSRTSGQLLPESQPVWRSPGHGFADLQRSVGNQGMLQLLESGSLQAKLRVSQPGDADEQEADRAAEHVSSQATPRLQRKCACGGSCASCQEEEQVLHRSAKSAPVLGSFAFSIQRQAAANATTEDASHRAPAAEAGARQDQAKHSGEHPRTLAWPGAVSSG
jgi:hypothetical protein